RRGRCPCWCSRSTLLRQQPPMTRINTNGRKVSRHNAAARSTRTRAARPGRKQSSPRCPLRVERLEDSVTARILGTFEHDGDVQTGVLGASGSKTTSHDWDQMFADAGSPAGDGTFTQGAVSGAIAGTFNTDVVNSNTDDIFTGGGSKDTLGIQAGKWLF